MEESGKVQTDVAGFLGISQQAFSQRLKTGKFTEDELDRIADFLGCVHISYFQFENGKKF